MKRSETMKYGRRYPWEAWISQGKVRLNRGADYNGRTDTFVLLAYTAAKRYGVRVHAERAVDDSSVTLRFER